MNENIIDVLVYLFENYLSEQTNLHEQYTKNHIYHGLEQAGFEKSTIDSAFAWLLSLDQQDRHTIDQSADAIRVYSAEEQSLLDQEGMDFISYLESNNILTPTTRELLLNGLLNLNADNIDVDDLQWLALIILFSQPDEEQAFASMESLMFDPPVDHEH
jgi:Smg protein